MAVFLEARTSMSSIHQRPITVSSQGEVAVGEDRIVWVGGASQPTTELRLHSSDAESLLALMPMERDITHFGLIQIRIPLAPKASEEEPVWWLYDNGIEPAPVTGTTLCGRQVVVVARPSSPSPRAPQELVWRTLGTTEPAATAIVARSQAFFEVSLAAVGEAGLLTYVADHRTWARTVRCTSS
jgi:hypothetical protein